MLSNFLQSKKQAAMETARVDLTKLSIETRPVEVKLENIRVKTRPLRVKMRNQGVALKGVRIILRKQRVPMRRVVVRVGNIGKVALEEESGAVNEQVNLNDLTSDISLRREIPIWAKTVNYLAEAKKQEENGPDTLFSIFAPVNLDDLSLEEDEIFKIPAKSPKHPRNFSLELDLSNFEFDPEELELM